MGRKNLIYPEETQQQDQCFNSSQNFANFQEISPGKRYKKLDDSIYLLCQNCGHSLKAEEIKKMAALAQAQTSQSESHQSAGNSNSRFNFHFPAHFLTLKLSGEAAQKKIAKLRQNLLNNVAKIRNFNPESQLKARNRDRRGARTRVSANNTNSLNNSNNPATIQDDSGEVVAISNIQIMKNLNNFEDNFGATFKAGELNSLNCSRTRRPFQSLHFDLEELESANMLELRPLGEANKTKKNKQSLESFGENSSSGSGDEDSSGGTASTLPIRSFKSNSSSSSSSENGSRSRWSRFAISNSEIPANNDHDTENVFKKKKIRSPLACSTPILSEERFSGQDLDTCCNQQQDEAEDLKNAPWFQAGIPREIALEVLKNEGVGSFIVRRSSTKLGCFALSLRVPSEFSSQGIAHYLILTLADNRYKIKGFTKEFGSLSALITHHSVMAELLPCTLALSKYLPPRERKTSTLARRPQKPLLFNGESADDCAIEVGSWNHEDFVEPEKLSMFRKLSTDF